MIPSEGGVRTGCWGVNFLSAVKVLMKTRLDFRFDTKLAMNGS